jgi:hypothetical protein
LAPGQNFQSTFDALQFREGDTEEDKLYKLAGVRQILENFNEVTQANPRIPDPQKALVTKLAAEAAAAVPFTRKDVIALSNAPPGTSIADIVKAHKLGTPATSAAPAGAAPPAAPPAAAPKVAPATMAFDTAEQAQAAAASGKLKPGTRITVGGTLGTWQ